MPRMRESPHGSSAIWSFQAVSAASRPIAPMRAPKTASTMPTPAITTPVARRPPICVASAQAAATMTQPNAANATVT